MNKIDSQKEIEKFIQNRRVKQEVENAIREKILETHVKHHFVLVFLALPFLIALFFTIKIFLLILKEHKKFNKRLGDK